MTKLFAGVTFGLVLILALVEPASAQGLSSVNDFLAQITSLLTGAGLAIVTIAIMWAGYKMIFAKASFTEIAPIFIGAMLIGGASTIAGYLL